MGTWVQETGTLKVTLKQTLLPHTGKVTLSFVLRNAAAAQTVIPEPKIGMVGVIPQRFDGSVLGAAGVAVLTSVIVEESGRVEAEENQLTFRLTSNIPLMQGVALTISHIVGRNEACQDQATVTTPFTRNLPPEEIIFDGAPQAVQSEVNQASLVGNGTQGLCVNDDG